MGMPASVPAKMSDEIRPPEKMLDRRCASVEGIHTICLYPFSAANFKHFA